MNHGRTVLEAKRLGVFACAPDTPLEEAARQMLKEDISSLVVTDEEGYLRGIVTRMDILRAYLGDAEGWKHRPAGEVMSRQVVTVTLQTTLREVARILTERHIHRVVATEREGDKERPLAVVSGSDLIYHLHKSAGHR